MKLASANKIRETEIRKIFEFYGGAENDCGMIASNSFNIPIVAENGEEGWLEVVAKVTKDNGDDGYLKRQAYEINLADKAKRKAEVEKKKAKKIAADEKRRAELKAKAEPTA